jgi:hypothetical protein
VDAPALVAAGTNRFSNVVGIILLEINQDKTMLVSKVNLSILMREKTVQDKRILGIKVN